jgi:hypothetical protein
MGPPMDFEHVCIYGFRHEATVIGSCTHDEEIVKQTIFKNNVRS